MKQTKLVLKDYFETGDKPTQQQYENLIDSLRHAYDKIPLGDLEEDVVSQSEFQSHLDNANFNGDVTAVNFVGDGSQLTGITLDNLPNNVAYTNIDNNFSVAQSISESSNSLKGLVITNTNTGSGAAASLQLTSDGGTGHIYKTSNAFGLGLADRLGIQNAEGISFVTGSTLTRYEIDSSGNHDFKSGAATFGGLLTANAGISADGISTFSNVASNWVKIDGGINGTNDAAIYARGNTLRIQNDNSNFGTGDISIEADGDTFITSATTISQLLTSSAGITLGGSANTTARNPQYLVFGGAAGSEYGMELGYDSTRAKYSTRIITSSSQDISFGAMNSPATDHSDFTEYFVIQNGGNFDFKSGQSTFGGLLTVTSSDNILANFISTDSIGEIRIGDNVATTRLLTVGSDFKIIPNSNEVAVFEGDTLKTILRGDLDVEGGATFNGAASTRPFNISGLISIQDGTTEKAYFNPTSAGVDFYLDGNGVIRLDSRDGTGSFAGNVTAPNFIGNVIGDQFTAGTSNGSVQIRNNSGQPIATFTNALNTSFTGDISIESDKFLYLGDSNNARLFANATNTFFDGLTGNMYFRNQSDGGKMYFQVEDLSGTDLDLIEIHGDTQDVLLRHGNSLKLQTTSEGVNVYGELSVIKSGVATPHADTDLFVADSSAAISYGQVEVLGGNNGASYLYFSDTDNYAAGGVKYSHANDNMTFRVNNHDLIELGDSKLFLGRNSTTGQVRIDYRKDANNSNGWYNGYLSGSNTDNNFGVYGYESDGDYRIYTNNNLALSINTSQDASFHSGITATGTITSNAGFSTGTQAANAGAIRLENGDAITSRNSANSGNRTLMYLDSSNVAQFSVSTDSIFGGEITNYGTLQINDDGGSGYTHSRIILDSGNNTRGAGIFSRGVTHDWYWGNPYLEHDKAFIIARTATGTNDAVAQYSNALFTLTDAGEAKAASFTQTGADVYTTISQLNASTSRFFADANLQIEAGASANILFLTNGAERARIDLNGLMTLKNGLTVTGNASATNFIGNWNGYSQSNFDAKYDSNNFVAGTDYAGLDVANTFQENTIFNKSVVIGGHLNNAVHPLPPNISDVFRIEYNSTSEEVEITADSRGVITLKDETKTALSTTELDSADDKVLVSKEWVIQYVASQIV